MTDPILRAEDLRKTFGGVVAVDDVSFEVERGSITGLIGPNGAGKSTLLKAIVGLLPVWSGSVEFAGEDISRTPPEETISRGICYVPQTTNVFASLSVRENLVMGAWTLEEDDFEARTEAVYEYFPDLRNRESELAGNLSGGQQQMVAMGAALMLDPELLVLDEPSAGLAPQLIDEVFERIAAINDAGTAVLMVEQNARRALRESDRGVVLDMGEDRFEGTSEELLESEEIAELYLGS